MKTFKHTSNIVYGTPWAIEPRAFDLVANILQRHIDGAEIPSVDSESDDSYSVKKNVAVIAIRGPIVPRSGMMSNLSGATSSEEIARAVTAAAASDVDGIILDIDSPGGSVIGGFECADAIYAAAQKKNTVACISGVGASLAYLFASQASAIYATRGSVVGSIGVIAQIQSGERMAKNAGIDTITVASSREKAMSGLSEDEIRSKLQGEVDKYMGMFVEAIGRSRKMDMGKVATGETWLADEALALGLIDGISTLEEMI